MAAGYQRKGNIDFYLLMKYVSLLTSRFSTICPQLKSCHLEAVSTWSFKNTSWYRCFQERHMHNLPRLNGCRVSNERQHCFLSADEICFTFNEPFFHNMSLTEIVIWRLCWHGLARIHPDIDVPSTPYAQSVAAEWLQGIKWKAILFSICWWNICHFYRAVFPQFVFNWSLVIWRLCWHGRARIHPDIDVSKNAICTICRGWMAAGYQMKGNIVFYLLMEYLSLLTSQLFHNMSFT